MFLPKSNQSNIWGFCLLKFITPPDWPCPQGWKLLQGASNLQKVATLFLKTLFPVWFKFKIIHIYNSWKDYSPPVIVFRIFKSVKCIIYKCLLIKYFEKGGTGQVISTPVELLPSGMFKKILT